MLLQPAITTGIVSLLTSPIVWLVLIPQHALNVWDHTHWLAEVAVQQIASVVIVKISAYHVIQAILSLAETAVQQTVTAVT